MDNEEGVDSMTQLLAHSLEGNALSVQDAVNAMMNQKAMDALSAMKVDVAQSIYGTYGSEDQESEMEAGPNDPEAEDDESEWGVPEDDDFGLDDQELDDLFGELEDLTGEEEQETDNEEEENPDE